MALEFLFFVQEVDLASSQCLAGFPHAHHGVNWGKVKVVQLLVLEGGQETVLGK